MDRRPFHFLWLDGHHKAKWLQSKCYFFLQQTKNYFHKGYLWTRANHKSPARVTVNRVEIYITQIRYIFHFILFFTFSDYHVINDRTPNVVLSNWSCACRRFRCFSEYFPQLSLFRTMKQILWRHLRYAHLSWLSDRPCNLKRTQIPSWM